MSKHEKLPYDIKQECLWIVRGYDRRVKQYHAQRQDVIESGGANYVTYTHIDQMKDEKTGAVVEKKEERREYLPHSGSVGRPSEDKQARLEAIESYPETLKMRAVEHAKLRIGLDCKSEEIRQLLINGIILNCESGRNYPFQYLNLPEFSDSDFHRRKDRFLTDIAKFLKII